MGPRGRAQLIHRQRRRVAEGLAQCANELVEEPAIKGELLPVDLRMRVPKSRATAPARRDSSKSGVPNRIVNEWIVSPDRRRAS